MRTDKVLGLKEKLKDMWFYSLTELEEVAAELIKEDFKLYFDDSTEGKKTSVIMLETVFTKLILVLSVNNLFGYFEVEDVIRLKEET